MQEFGNLCKHKISPQMSFPEKRCFPLEPLLAFNALQFQRHKVVTVGALQFDRVPFPPGQTTAELKGLQSGKDIVVEETAQSGWIVAAEFKRLPGMVAGVAFAFDAQYRSGYPVADSRIFCHFSPLLGLPLNG